MKNDDEELGESYLVEDGGYEEAAVTGASKKKKRETSEPRGAVLLEESDDEGGEAEKPAKKKKKRAKKSPAERADEDPRAWDGAAWDAWLVATRNAPSEVAARVERAPAGCADAAAFAKLRTAAKPQNAAQARGLLEVVIVCGSAKRAGDVARAMRQHKGKAVAKLFGKHIKLADQVAQLQADSLPRTAVGTPARLRALQENIRGGLPFA